MFLLGHDPFLASQIATVVTLAIMNPDYTVNLFLTKNQLNPSRFGNKKGKLIVLLLFIAEAASHMWTGNARYNRVLLFTSCKLLIIIRILHFRVKGWLDFPGFGAFSLQQMLRRVFSVQRHYSS